MLDGVLTEVSELWKKRGYGTNVGHDFHGHRLTHIAFADDQTLVARSWVSMKRMILMLRSALHDRGLSLHPTKCKVQTTNSNFTRRGQVSIAEGFSIEVLPPGENLELLGTALSLVDPTGEEITNRIAVGWRKFWAMKHLLLNKSFSIKKRLRLFDTTVAECILWSTESWTPRAEELRRLRVTQHTMLRRIVGCGRAEEETWVDWIQRATCKARRLARDSAVKEWAPEHFKRKWRWAGATANKDPNEWVWKVTEWRDAAWQAAANELGAARPMRPSSRKWMRFEDVMRRFCTQRALGGWRSLARSTTVWQALSSDFVEWAAEAKFDE